MSTIRQLATEIEGGLAGGASEPAQDGDYQASLGRGRGLGGPDPEYRGSGECLALGDGTTGYARAVAAPLVEKSLVVQCGDPPNRTTVQDYACR